MFHDAPLAPHPILPGCEVNKKERRSPALGVQLLLGWVFLGRPRIPVFGQLLPGNPPGSRAAFWPAKALRGPTDRDRSPPTLENSHARETHPSKRRTPA